MGAARVCVDMVLVPGHHTTDTADTGNMGHTVQLIPTFIIVFIHISQHHSLSSNSNITPQQQQHNNSDNIRLCTD